MLRGLRRVAGAEDRSSPGHPETPLARNMKILKVHGPVLLALVAVTYVAYGRLLSAPVWNPLDYQILHEASLLSRDPLQMFRHIGTYLNQPLLQISPPATTP
jgi:hypothetical protein